MTEARAAAPGRDLLLFVLAITPVLLVRIIALNADPSADLQAGFISDFGGWWKNARQHALWGAWALDGINRGWYAATGHTLALRAVFELFGVGRVQALAVSAASGVLTAAIVWRLARGAWSARVAVAAVLLLGLAPLAVAFDRSAYPESLMTLWLTAALAGVAMSASRARAALGGAALAAAVITKVTGVIGVPIAATAWAGLWALDRASGERRHFAWGSFLAFWAAAAAVMAPFLLLFVLPNRVEMAHQLATMSATNFADSDRALSPDRVLFFGWNGLGLRRYGFFTMQWPLVAAATALAAARLARALRQPVTAAEIVCWAWLSVGLLSVAVLPFQPNRRYEMLVVPAAVLTAMLVQPITLGASGWASRGLRRAGQAAAAALLAGTVAFALVPLVVWKMMAVGRRFGRTWDYGVAGSAFVSVALAGAVAVALLAGDRLRWPARTVGWTVGLPMLALALACVHLARDYTRRSYGMDRTVQVLDRLTARWPRPERLLWGWTAATHTMGTRLLGVSPDPEKPDLQARLRPRLIVYTTPFADTLGAWASRDGPGGPFIPCARIPMAVDAGGGPRFMVHLLTTEDRLDACRAAAALP